MSLILNIDTSGGTASVTIANDGTILESISNDIQKDHAAFLHTAISRILRSASIHLSELEAVAVSAGPGSYTGIRVGMASAKGFCIALDKPLILINTLEVMAKDAIMHYPSNGAVMFCPMIDARRMEVYTALYDCSLNEVLKPCAMILDESSYMGFTNNYTIIMFGNGSVKSKTVVKLRNSIFIENVNIPKALAIMSYELLLSKSFADVAYSEPLYLKEFYNGA